MKVFAVIFALVPSLLGAAEIVFLGDSITAGYGLDRSAAYPSLIATRLSKEKLPFRVANAGVSGDTTADGLRRIGQVATSTTGVVVIALGANDALQRIPPEIIEGNLRAIIAKARATNPRMRILLCGMRIFENFGPIYARAFAEVFPRVARETEVALLPFLLEGVGGVARLNLPDRIHPSSDGQKIIAENLWRVLLPLLRESEKSG